MDTFSKDEMEFFTKSPIRLKCSDFFQKRYILVILCIFGVLNIYTARMSMSMGLVCMVNHTAILNRSHQEQMSNDSEVYVRYREDGPFLWDAEVQGIILSSFFWGYITTQFAGGFLADRHGGKWVWGFTLLISSLLTMLSPFAARFNTIVFIGTRVFCGAAQGFTFPALVSILSKWAPVQERARLFALSLLGIPFGVILTYSVAPVLCTSHLLGGWPMLFYFTGSLGIVWFIIWIFFMYDYPSDHPIISEKEKLYIESSNMYDHKPYLVKIPWTHLLKSTPMWALAICEFCHAYKYFMIITQLPTYLKVVLDFNLHENGIYSSVPHFITPFLAVLAGWGADVLLINKKMSVGTLRKSATFVGFSISSLCLLGVTLLSTQRATEIVALIWISCFMDSLCGAGFDMTPYDMSPNFAGTIKGIVHTFAAAGGIAAPYVIGILTKHNNTKSSWDIAFYIAIGLYLFGGLTFVLFASGDIQPWNDVGSSSNEVEHLIVNGPKSTKEIKGKVHL